MKMMEKSLRGIRLNGKTPCILKLHLISVVSLTVLPVFLGHLSPLNSYLQVTLTNLIFGSRSFHAAIPTTWNPLSYSTRSFYTLNSFRRNLK